MLAHVVVALKKGAPHKVQCNTCEANHVYKSAPPASRKRSTKPPKPTEYERAMKSVDPETAVPYTPKGVFEAGNVLNHKTLGIGLVTEEKGTDKIYVLFPEGTKLLIHHR